MATLESIEAKLDLLLQAGGGVAAPAKAYDIPVLSVDQVVVDGKTVNRDGSIWGVSYYDGQAGPPTQEFFGYISPVKTPEIWDFAKKHFSPEVFARWDKGWQENPYGVYKADVRDLIAKGVLNFMSFSAMLGQPSRTFVQ